MPKPKKSNSKQVQLPPDLQARIVAEVKVAKYGEVKAIAERYGITKARIYYYRKLAGTSFKPEERATWLRTRPYTFMPARRIPKLVGVPHQPSLDDFTADEWGAIRALGRQLNILEPLTRIDLQRRAYAGSVQALLTLYERYHRLRLPMAEARLSPEQRACLPWLQTNGNAHGSTAE